MCNVESKTYTTVVVTGDPGICGFPCTIKAQKSDKRMVRVTIVSECKQIQKLGGLLTQISLKELFLPITRNPVYVAAEKSGCHAACCIPVAVIKAVEVALGLALPQAVSVQFTKLEE